MAEARPWLLLPIETKVREFHAKTLLATVAAARGFDVLLGEQNAILAQLPRLPRGIYIDKSVARTKRANFRRLKALGSHVAAWCEEGLVYFSREAYLRDRIDLEALGEVDRFFAWGHVQADDVQSKAPALDGRIVISGNPRLDLLRSEFRALFRRDVERLRRVHGRLILVNTNFGRFNHYLGTDAAIHLLRARGLITSAEDERYHRQWSAFAGTLFESFAAVLPELARALPDHTIVLRPHPSENHQTWRDRLKDAPQVRVIHEGSVVPWLMAADAVMHNSCMTGLEAYLLDVPAVCYRPATSEAFEARLPNAVSHHAFTPEELVAHLSALSTGHTGPPETAGAEARRHIAALDGELAAERVVTALSEVDPAPHAFAPGPAARLQIAATNAAIALKPALRRVRQGARANAYLQQKFPGITLAEVRETLSALQTISGRYGSVRAEGMAARDCFRITSAPA